MSWLRPGFQRGALAGLRSASEACPVDKDAANSADEALWVTLYRHHPDECLLEN